MPFRWAAPMVYRGDLARELGVYVPGPGVTSWFTRTLNLPEILQHGDFFRIYDRLVKLPSVQQRF